MGWSKSVACCAWALLGVGLTSAGCGGADTSPTEASGGATAAGAGAGGAAGTSKGGAPAAGHSSGGSAVGSAGTDSVGAAAGAPSTVNLYVDSLRGREGCLPRSLPVAQTAADGFAVGQVRCQIAVASQLAGDAVCACDAAEHLKSPAPGLVNVVANHAKQIGVCGDVSGVDCQSFCICELEQSSGEALTQCQTDTTPIAQLPTGFCYVDASLTPPLGNPALVATCPESMRRELRILGPIPQPAPLLFLACSGGTL